MASAVRAAALLIVAATLGACSTGGGGGSAPVPPPGDGGDAGGGGGGQGGGGDQGGGGTSQRTDVPFTSFSAVQANQNVIMSGSATTMGGTQMDGASTLALGFDGERSLTALAITAPQGSVSFDRSAGHSVSCTSSTNLHLATCRASNPTASAMVAESFSRGWNYQTYGVWAVQSNPTGFVLGAVSAGNATPGNAVPTAGLANFSGLAQGYFIDTAGVRFTTSAAMFANVDFQSRVINFSAEDTAVFSNTGAARSVQELDVIGSFTWAAGANNFSGPLRTRDRSLNGSGSGRFYGPAAQEIGGTYALQGTGPSRMVGGFGGQRH